MKSFSFAKHPPFDEINSCLTENGVVVIEDFLNEADCDAIASILEGKQLMNSNELSFVQVLDSRFFSNALGVSREAFNLVTKPEALEISKNYLGQDIRLKCHRAYTTTSIANFPWHTDNKFDANKNDVFGIVFIIYLADTFEGGTEFVLGSHKFSNNFTANNFLDSYISQEYGDKVLKTKGKKGTAIISDTRTIHRGGYSASGKINRRSFWFQVEANMEGAERLLLNPEFLPEKPSESLTRYLGFGRSFGLTVHPHTTNVHDYLPIDYRIKEFFKYALLIAKIPVYWLKSRLNYDLKAKIKRLILFRKVDVN